ncbi:thioredoxin-dependent thiol peroxidase [Planctomycetota bacterium]|nr:thioredoxin-dependent thiol peroxidase [Planctomycetota bacterium]
MAKKKATAKKKASSKSSTASNLVEAGKAAPAFALKDHEGKTHRLSQYKNEYVVLYFYPRDNTSGCTKQACAFRDEIEEFSNLDAKIIGISPDNEASHTKFIDKHDLPFLLLSDPDHIALNKYGVWQEKNMYGRKVMGVVRTTYIINPKGKVAARFDKVRVADHIPKVIEELKKLQD